LALNINGHNFYMPPGNMLFFHVSYIKTIQNEWCGYIFSRLNIFNIAMWQHIICCLGHMVSHKWKYKYNKLKDEIVFFLHSQSMLPIIIVLCDLSKATKRILVVTVA
jgi:hypothetical protein